MTQKEKIPQTEKVSSCDNNKLPLVIHSCEWWRVEQQEARWKADLTVRSSLLNEAFARLCRIQEWWRTNVKAARQWWVALFEWQRRLREKWEDLFMVCVKRFHLLTGVCNWDSAVEVLLLHRPFCVIWLSGDSTESITVHFDSCR